MRVDTGVPMTSWPRIFRLIYPIILCIVNPKLLRLNLIKNVFDCSNDFIVVPSNASLPPHISAGTSSPAIGGRS